MPCDFVCLLQTVSGCKLIGNRLSHAYCSTLCSRNVEKIPWRHIDSPPLGTLLGKILADLATCTQASLLASHFELKTRRFEAKINKQDRSIFSPIWAELPRGYLAYSSCQEPWCISARKVLTSSHFFNPTVSED